MNEIKLSGTIFGLEVKEKIATFDLSFYNGKNKDGSFKKSGYIQVKYFENMNFREKEKVEVTGYLTEDYWEKDGKKYSKLCLIAKEIRAETKSAEKPEEKSQLDDEIIF